MRKIIAVDNSTKHIQVFQQILGQDYEVFPVGDTEEALEILGGGDDRFSLVLLNIDEFPLEGIAIAENEDVAVSELMRRANTALWEGKSEKTAKYVIHEAKPADSIA